MARVDSIDALRGVTIFAMIFCASIGYGSDLPAWMFHCQCPPPSYAFNPDVRGITWVDLVFPFFIFAMGAAIPFSLGGKLAKGEGTGRVIFDIFKRGVVLSLFSVIIGNGNVAAGAVKPYWLSVLLGVVMFASMFAAFVRVPGRRWLNLIGWGAMAALLAIQHFVFGIPVKLSNCDIIIYLLAVVSVVTGLVWLLTRSSYRLRIAAWLLVVSTKLLGIDFLQYAVIAIPATIAGDMIREGLEPAEARSHVPSVNPGFSSLLAAIAALSAIFVQLWGLYNRQILADGLVTLALAAGFVLLTFRSGSLFARFGYASFLLILIGIVFDPLDGGIAKDYCNLSYLFTTLGCAGMMLCFLMRLEASMPLSRAFVMTGRNPMIAYTIPWLVISPCLYLTGFMGWMDTLCAGNPWLGLLRGVVVTSLTLAFTCLFTYRKLYWKS